MTKVTRNLTSGKMGMCPAMTNRCRLCRRILKDPSSIAKGIGPTCESKSQPVKKRVRRPRVKVKAAVEDVEQQTFEF